MRRAGATALVDKTPSYIYILDEVMRMTPGVPVGARGVQDQGPALWVTRMPLWLL